MRYHLSRRLAVTFICVVFPLNSLARQALLQQQPIPQRQSVTVTTVGDPDEYAVWKALLEQKYGGRAPRIFVISDRTAVDAIGKRSPIPDAFLSEETGRDFLAKNTESYALDSKVGGLPAWPVISTETANQLFPFAGITSIDSETIQKMQNSWRQFYQKYPNTHGILALSRVGFNSEKTTALVYVKYDGGVMSHNGSYYLLKLVGASWQIQFQKLMWLS